LQSCKALRYCAGGCVGKMMAAMNELYKASYRSPERDGITFDCIEEYGVVKHLEEISKELSVGGNPVEVKRMMAYYETRE